MTPVESLHAAYCEASGQQIPLMVSYERYWFDCDKAGLTAEDVRLVVASIIKRNSIAEHGFRKIITPGRLFGDDDAIGEAVSIAAEIKARARKKTFPPSKASVLRATGRPDEPEPPKTRHISEIINLKQAAK